MQQMKPTPRSRTQQLTSCLALGVLALFLTGARTKIPRGVPTPNDVYAAFESTLKTRDINSFMRVCAKPLANFSPGMSCGSMLNEAWHEGRTFTKIADQNGNTPDKALIEVKSTQKGKDLTLFFLLGKEENGLWVIKNINENREWSENYIKGVSP